MKKDGLKLMLGVAIGTAIGAAIAYFYDEEKRNAFVDNVNDAADKVGNNVKDAYYEARIRGRKAKRDLSRYVADLKGDAEELYDDMKDRANKWAKEGGKKYEEMKDKAEDKYAEIKDKAEEAADEAKQKVRNAANELKK